MKRTDIAGLAATVGAPLLVLGFAVPSIIGYVPGPLDVKNPTLAVSLQEAMEPLPRLLGDLDAASDYVVGVGAVPPTDSLSPAGKAAATTWLTHGSHEVQTLASLLDSCETALNQATAMLDPEQTLLGYVDQVDPDSTPAVVSDSQVNQTLTDLNTCVTEIPETVTAAENALDTAQAEAGITQATVDNMAARDSLTIMVTAAQSLLDTTAGRVSDATCRDTLAAAINSAHAVLANPTPKDSWDTIDTDTAAITATQSALNTATATVNASHATYTAEQQASKNPTTKSPTKTGSTNKNTSSSSGTRTPGTNPDGSGYGPPKQSTYVPRPSNGGCTIIEGSLIC